MSALTAALRRPWVGDVVEEPLTGELGTRRGVARVERPAAGRRVERDPAPAGEVDLDPVMRLVIRHGPLVRIGVVAPAREPGSHASRNAEVAEHERHRAGEVLAVAALRLRDELDERRLVRRGHRRLLVVDEPAERRLAEPGLERSCSRVRIRRALDDLLGDVVERAVLLHEWIAVEARVEEDIHQEVAVGRAELRHRGRLDDLQVALDRLRVVRPGLPELLGSGPRRVAPDRVGLVALQRAGEDDDVAALVLEGRVGGRVPAHRLRRGDQVVVLERLHGHLLLDPVGLVAGGRREKREAVGVDLVRVRRRVQVEGLLPAGPRVVVESRRAPVEVSLLRPPS